MINNPFFKPLCKPAIIVGMCLFLSGATSCPIVAQDLQGISVVRRGYGGARFSDLSIFLDRLLANHHPKAIVYFVANDISGNAERDITPERVGELARFIMLETRKRFPDTNVFVIETTPTPSRREHWSKISIANDLIRDLTDKDDRCHFIETRSAFLSESGEPRQELFRDDQLHLNADGASRGCLKEPQ